MWFNLAIGFVVVAIVIVMIAEIRRNKVSDTYLAAMFFYIGLVPLLSLFALIMHQINK